MRTSFALHPTDAMPKPETAISSELRLEPFFDLNNARGTCTCHIYILLRVSIAINFVNQFDCSCDDIEEMFNRIQFLR